MANFTNQAEVVNTSGYYPQTDVLLKPTRQKPYLIVKRAMDILGSSVGILILLPLLVFIVLLIKLNDPRGAILFKQTRIGENGKPFTMYKFRSMVSDSEERLAQLLHNNEISGAMFKMKHDPRVTRVGKYLRKLSLDELPQLWNVLINDMSLVGPRPALPREVELYTSYDQQRLLVKPGCTGLWQVSGRNGLSFEQMVELDLYYIRNRSIWMDIKVAMKTIWVMINSHNAY
jgi:lipopolysaccharide/colanic/teichoic acid biosynthesis glycosyltransferase